MVTSGHFLARLWCCFGFPRYFRASQPCLWVVLFHPVINKRVDNQSTWFEKNTGGHISHVKALIREIERSSSCLPFGLKAHSFEHRMTRKLLMLSLWVLRRLHYFTLLTYGVTLVWIPLWSYAKGIGVNTELIRFFLCLWKKCKLVHIVAALFLVEKRC